MIPAAIILIPVIRSIPWLYSWRHRRKFHYWYRELKKLELEITESPGTENMPDYHEKIDQIESSINRISAPLAFFDEVYKLQEHVHWVRGRLVRLSHPAKENHPQNDL